ncbi:MAG: carbamoyl-phosphate synthase large subunit [Candidatus Ratteibacteria bacterium]|nr:carbamoyl-phosphate synthase large subunit [Candidatus Ratteibacteria bacterium]
MPKRTDIKRIMIIGSGPIVIGQACEFDYSGSQACKALKEDGYYIILVNSNPATIMTDPEMADRIYLEPLVPEVVAKIVERERPDALLPTLGGQTALNITVALEEMDVLKKYGVEVIGANYNAIKKAEDRLLFKKAASSIGIKVPDSGVAYKLTEATEIAKNIGFPVIIRPSFTLGGTGGSVAYNIEEFKEFADTGLKMSPVNEILIEQSVLGWKEYELEVMRDRKGNAVIICSVENLDPMGVHTGDSITVAPVQTLTDREYQRMRIYAIRIMEEIGVETGGSNVQFAVNQENGEMVIIEMNPRVSRSSALASKATGFPIAKIAAKLAVGYTLDEIPNDITKKTLACFEPAIDYCVVKIPKFNFEKFSMANPYLTISMKSVGEVMAIGRTFKEALNKALRSLEEKFSGYEDIMLSLETPEGIRTPNPLRLFYIKRGLDKNMSIEEISALSRIDKWFLYNLKELVDYEKIMKKYKGRKIPAHILRKAKEYGFSDRHIARVTGRKDELEIKKLREIYGINPDYKLVDTCAGEFESYTPYYYSTYK